MLRSFAYASLSMSWLIGSLLLYSDATHESPVHNQAIVGLGLIWLPVIALLAYVFRGPPTQTSLISDAGSRCRRVRDVGLACHFRLAAA